MKVKSKQSGVTLTEMTVVAAVIALLVAFGLPAISALFGSFESGGSVKGLISAGLASARAIAASRQSYAGIRFQQIYSSEGALKADQYMIFIVHDFGSTGLANGFRAVEGLKPIKLPDSVGVMDLYTMGASVVDDSGIDDLDKVTDTTTFSIVFSPAGKLVTHDVRARPQNANDSIFNDLSTSDAMFQEDSDHDFPYWQELSRNSFIIYDRKEFEHAYKNVVPYSDYLVELVPIYISPYTGTIIPVD